MEKISLRIKILLAIVSLIIAICPFLGGGLTEDFAWSVILLLSALVLILFAFYIIIEKKEILLEKKPWPLFFLIIFIVVGVLSSIFSIRTYNSWSELIIWLAAIVIFFIFSQLSSEKIIKYFSWLYLAVGSAVSLTGFFLYIFSQAKTNLRLESVFYQPNLLAGFLISILPIALTLSFLDNKKNIKILLFLINILIGTAFILTFSYTGWFCLLFVLIILFIKYRQKLFNKKFLFVALLSLLIIISSVFIIRYAHTASWQTTTSISQTISEEHAAISYTQRLDFIKMGSAIFLKYPLTGIGFNNLKLVFVQLQKNVVETPRSLHNHYLDLLVAMGIFGLLSFVGFIISLCKKNKKVTSNFYCFGLFLGCLGILLHGAIDFAWQSQIIVINFFIFSGLLYGLYLRNNQTVTKKNKLLRIAIIILCLIFASIFLLRGIQIYLGNRYQANGDFYQDARNLNVALESYQTAWKYNKDPNLLGKIGIIEYTKKKYEAAEKTSLHWLKLSPQDANAYQLLGRVYRQQNKITEAEAQLTKAIALNPLNNIEIKNDLMEIYLQEKKYTLIIEQVDPFLDIYQDKPTVNDQIMDSTNMNMAKMLDYLGEAYLAQGVPAKAKESWERALAIRPSFQIAKNKLDELEKQ